MRRVYDQISRAAKTDVTVLIQGETGTGKELVARAIHYRSARSSSALVAMNCSAIPEGLIESELFGAERGAYTGAFVRTRGKVHQASKGTLFLDEIGDLAVCMQSKLLRVIQERSFHRLGGTEVIHCDFRLIAATHRNLSSMITAQEFREDLYYRVAVFEIDVPPLRERRADIPLLAAEFLSCFRGTCNSRAERFSDSAQDALSAYHWPGNVRELQNAVQRALLMCEGPVIQTEHLPNKILARHEVAPPALFLKEPTSIRCNDAQTLADREREVLQQTIQKCRGNLALVVRKLSMGRGRLYRKLKKYELTDQVQMWRAS
jgi:DNA-binding NtrC family response regulator